MPYHAHWERAGLRLDAYGVVTLADVIAEQERFYSDPRSDDAEYVIWNSLGADEIRMELKDFLTPAAGDLGASRSVRGLKVALVAVDPVMRKICEEYIRVLARSEKSWAVRLFASNEAARAWAIAGQPKSAESEF